MDLFNLFKPRDKSQKRLKDLIIYNADIIQKTEGKSRKDSEYLAICMIIDDLSKRPRGSDGYQKIMEILSRNYHEHLGDVMTYVGWSTGRLQLKPEAEDALRKRHARASRPTDDSGSGVSGFTEKDGEKLILAQSEQCIHQIAEKWVNYNTMITFKPEVPLSKIIEGFANPIQQFVRNEYPLLDAAGPALLWLMIFRGIEQTGSPSPDAVNRAIQELDAKFRTPGGSG